MENYRKHKEVDERNNNLKNTLIYLYMFDDRKLESRKVVEVRKI